MGWPTLHGQESLVRMSSSSQVTELREKLASSVQDMEEQQQLLSNEVG